MNYSDLHCDTLTKIADGKRDTHITKEKAAFFEKYNQCYAIFLDDTVHGITALEKAKSYYQFYKDNKVLFSGKNAEPILTLENAVSLGGNLDNISFWKQCGIRACTLTWNGKNELGSGSSFPNGEGLTDFGKKAVTEFENAGIAVDVSHLNEAGFNDVLRTAQKPFIASHSNCYSLCSHPRNLKDYQIKEIINAGGLIGICFYKLFLGNGNVFDLIFNHVCHVIELGGENNVCFGSDFDGAKPEKKLDSIEKVKNLYDYFRSKGFDDNLCDKIFYRNADYFFNNVLHIN